MAFFFVGGEGGVLDLGLSVQVAFFAGEYGGAGTPRRNGKSLSGWLIPLRMVPSPQASHISEHFIYSLLPGP